MIENTLVSVVVCCAPPYMHYQKRQDCVLLTPSLPGIGDVRAAERLGRAGEQEGDTDAPGPHVQDDVCAQSARQDRLQRGQTRNYCQIIEGDGGAWMGYRGDAEGDEGPEGDDKL